MIVQTYQSDVKYSKKRGSMPMPGKTLWVVMASSIALIILGWVIYTTAFAEQGLQTRAANPRADFWRLVRDGQTGVTTVSGQERGVLIQSSGEDWRRIRNDLVAGISPWLLGGVLAAITLFFIFHGPDRLEKKPSGETVDRWPLHHRLLHWYTALLFMLMGVTGLSMLFGRAVLMPILGHTVFAGYMGAAIKIHNYGGPLFMAGLLLEIIAWAKSNIPTKIDLIWFKSLGGMVGKGPRPHAEKINGGSKAWFWFVGFGGIVVSLTGLMMLFPELGQMRWMIQMSHVIHAIVAILFIAGSLGHIYLGSIGAEGTFQGMWKGKVSVEWAQQHNNLWYAKIRLKNI